MNNGVKRFSIITATIGAVAALAMAGFFAAIIGVLFLPFMLASKKQNPLPPESKEPQKPNGNVIEADFSRVNKPEDK